MEHGKYSFGSIQDTYVYLLIITTFTVVDRILLTIYLLHTPLKRWKIGQKFCILRFLQSLFLIQIISDQKKCNNIAGIATDFKLKFMKSFFLIGVVSVELGQRGVKERAGRAGVINQAPGDD